MQVVLKEKLKKQIKFTDLNAKKKSSTDNEACAYWNICKENQGIDLHNRVLVRYVMSKTDFESHKVDIFIKVTSISNL